MWARLCLGSFPGLVRALVKFRTRGPQVLTAGNAQDSQSLPFFVCQRVTRTWSWDISQKQWISQRRRIRPRLAQGKYWEKKNIHRPAPVQNFSLQKRKKWGPQRKDFGGGYGFPGLYRVFGSTTGLESFSLRPEKFSKRFSFGGGCVRVFSSLK